MVDRIKLLDHIHMKIDGQPTIVLSGALGSHNGPTSVRSMRLR